MYPEHDNDDAPGTYVGYCTGTRRWQMFVAPALSGLNKSTISMHTSTQPRHSCADLLLLHTLRTARSLLCPACTCCAPGCMHSTPCSGRSSLSACHLHTSLTTDDKTQTTNAETERCNCVDTNPKPSHHTTVQTRKPVTLFTPPLVAASAATAAASRLPRSNAG